MKAAFQNHSEFLSLIMEFTLLALCMLAVPLAIAIDVLVFNHGVKEISVTEFSQSCLLLLSTIYVGLAAWRQAESRGFLVLVTGLLAAMLIRETDMFLDYIAQGFWVYPALIVSVAAIVTSIRYRAAIIPTLVKFSANRSFAYLVIGLLLVILFSRAFGTGWFWSKVMMDDFDRLYKTIIQEGLELLGYVLVCFGSFLTYRPGRNKADADSPDGKLQVEPVSEPAPAEPEETDAN